MRRRTPAGDGDFPLEWERVLWSGRAGFFAGLSRIGQRYHVTDFRVVVDARTGPPIREIAVLDIGAVDLRQTRWQRLRGTGTLIIRSKRERVDPLVLADIRPGPQLALVLQLLATDRLGVDFDSASLKGAIADRRADPFHRTRMRVTTAALVLGATTATLVGLRIPHVDSRVRHAADDPLYPNGQKSDRASIVAFMEREVMPVAQRTLGPLKGGPDKVTCLTCHGKDAEARNWQMPAVQALPEPELRMAGLERSSNQVDAQLRNAIYGYLAEEGKQGKAAYMRGVVLPEMARLLHRPPYDFTKSYEYNRSRGALGCYHCHRVN